jgi:uncharacterized protein (TIGR00255 family)
MAASHRSRALPSVQSMTAFARREASFAWGTLSWEIRSVNHRYLEAQLRLPETLRQVEMPARELLRERLARGKVDCILRLQAGPSATGPIAINDDLVRSLHEACARVDALAGGLGRPGVLDLLRWPGVIAESHPDEDEIARSALAVFRQALDELIAMRAREGASLASAIEQRLAGIETIVASVRAVLPESSRHRSRSSSTAWRSCASRSSRAGWSRRSRCWPRDPTSPRSSTVCNPMSPRHATAWPRARPADGGWIS